MLFQIADELGGALCRIDSKQKNNPVDSQVRRLVYNDAGHARRLLEAFCPDKEKFKDWFPEEPLSRDTLPTKLAPYQRLFARCALWKLAALMSSQYGQLSALLQAFAASSSEASPYLNPTHRFAVAAALAAWGRGLEQYDQTFRLEPQVSSPRERSQTVDAMRDPLEIMVEKLGLRRFITTNYDVDIEQLIADRGFRLRQFKAVSAGGDGMGESINALEARARDLSFNKDGRRT